MLKLGTGLFANETDYYIEFEKPESLELELWASILYIAVQSKSIKYSEGIPIIRKSTLLNIINGLDTKLIELLTLKGIKPELARQALYLEFTMMKQEVENKEPEEGKIINFPGTK